MLFSRGPNKSFLVPGSCRVMVRNGNSIVGKYKVTFHQLAGKQGRKPYTNKIIYFSTMYAYYIPIVK